MTRTLLGTLALAAGLATAAAWHQRPAPAPPLNLGEVESRTALLAPGEAPDRLPLPAACRPHRWAPPAPTLVHGVPGEPASAWTVPAGTPLRADSALALVERPGAVTLQAAVYLEGAAVVPTRALPGDTIPLLARFPDGSLAGWYGGGVVRLDPTLWGFGDSAYVAATGPPQARLDRLPETSRWIRVTDPQGLSGWVPEGAVASPPGCERGTGSP